jgi:UDP-3-O-[3-hydroxymyristoyl] glucosamine N-acyltransferase
MPIIKSNSNYTIIHDLGKSLCFVGTTHNNLLLQKHFSDSRNAVLISLEDIQTKNQQWLDSYQFMSISSHPVFKYKVKSILDHLNIQYFSIIGDTCVIGQNVDIGYNAFIDHGGRVWTDCKIGDHCSLTQYAAVGHGTTFGECCQIGAFCQVTEVKCGNGVYIGSRSMLHGTLTPGSTVGNIVTIADYTNIKARSMICKSIEVSGTYYGNKKVDHRNSLELSL